MILQKDEFKIQDNGIWISKKALEEHRQHYIKLADKFKPKKDNKKCDFCFPYYIGKEEMCLDLLKHFEPLEP